MKKLSFLFIILITGLLSACASHKTVQDPGAGFQGQSEKHIYVTGEQALLSGNYKTAIKHFQAIQVLFPFSKRAEEVQLDIIYAYYMSGDTASTLAAADRYIHLYPMSRNVDYAYYMRGLAEFYEDRGVLERYFNTDYAQRDLMPLRQSFLDFSRLVYQYPNSKYTPDARQRMIYIRNMIAQHNLEVAKFYYDRTAYVGAINRCNEVIQHFQQSAMVPGALILLTESYIKLKDFQSARRSYNVLKLNFPHNPAVPDLARKLNRAMQKG